LASANLPILNSSHPQSVTARCTSRNVNQISPIFFEGTFDYESPARPDDEDPDQPAYELPVDIEWSGQSSDEAIDEDFNGEPIVIPGTNEPIQGLTRPVSDLVGTFTKNMLTFNPVSILYYKDTTNSDTFLGFVPGLGRILDIKAVNQVKDDLPFWKVTVTIAFRVPYNTTPDKAWWTRVLCQGFYHLEDYELSGYDFTRKVRAMDDEKSPTVSPVLLDADGYLLAEGATPVWLEFQKFGTSNFNSLGLF
jgi:hypothetical protein